MARPTKCRRICHMPLVQEFMPTGQLECSKRMGVSRTTVQKIYEVARRKVADALVEGRPLKIQGGDFQLCEGNDCLEQECFKRCGHGCYCGKHCCHHKQI